MAEIYDMYQIQESNGKKRQVDDIKGTVFGDICSYENVPKIMTKELLKNRAGRKTKPFCKINDNFKS